MITKQQPSKKTQRNTNRKHNYKKVSRKTYGLCMVAWMKLPIWFNPKIVHQNSKIMKESVFNMPNNNSSNNLLVPGVEQALEQMKYEIANEFGVNLGAETTSRANGSVGGEITKRLVQMAEQQLGGTR